MTWAVFVLGLLLATLGATAGSALIATSRAELARFAATQLRGGGMPLARLAEVERLLIAASSTTSLGVLLLGAALVGLLAGAGRLTSLLVLLLVGVPAVVVGGYLLPRLFATRRAEQALRVTLPVLRPWSAPARPAAADRWPRRRVAVPRDPAGWRGGRSRCLGRTRAGRRRADLRRAAGARGDDAAHGHRGDRGGCHQVGDRPGVRAERLQPAPGVPRHPRRDRRHAARVRPLPARAGGTAAHPSGLDGTGEPRLRRPAHRHAARAAADGGGARRVWRHGRHRDAR